MVRSMEISTVHEAGMAGSCDQGEEEGHMITLFQSGQAAARVINSRSASLNSGLVGTPLVGHSRMPPPPHGVFKEAGEPRKLSVPPQEENSSLGKLRQERTNTWIGKTPAGEYTLLESPFYQGLSLSPRSQSFPCIDHHSPPAASLSLLYLTDSSGATISRNSLPWLSGSPCCCHLFL